MKKIRVRITVPFAVMHSSQPGRAGDGPSILEVEVMARDKTSAIAKVERGLKVNVEYHSGEK
jgi:hypothetical protein